MAEILIFYVGQKISGRIYAPIGLKLLRWQERGAVASVCRRNGMAGVDGTSTNDATTKQSDNKRVTA